MVFQMTESSTIIWNHKHGIENINLYKIYSFQVNITRNINPQQTAITQKVRL